MPLKPTVSLQEGVQKSFGGGDESLARRRAAAEMVATNAQEKAEGPGALIAGIAPTILNLAGEGIGGALGGPAGAKAGGAIGSGVGQVIQSLDTSAAEQQKAEQDLENIRAEEEGRQAQQIKAKESSTKKAGAALGSILGNKDVQEKLGSLGNNILGGLSIGGM